MIENKKKKFKKVVDCVLIVLSCRKYREVASLTIDKLLNLNVHNHFDCYYSISDQDLPNKPNFNPLFVFDYSSWSADLIKIIDQINSKYVFIWIDDLYPLGYINWELVKNLLNDFRNLDGNYLRLNPYPKGDIITSNKNLNIISNRATYRTSTVLSIWKKSILKKLLLESENAWQFEIFGSIRSSTYEGFYSSNIKLVDYLNVVIKGQILPSAERIINQEGFSTKSINLRRMNFFKNMLWQIRSKFSILFGKLPYPMQNIYRKFKYKRKLKNET